MPEGGREHTSDMLDLAGASRAHGGAGTTAGDPFRAALLGAGRALPGRMRACAEPLRGEPAFDPAEVAQRADALPLPRAARFEHPLLERSVRVGLAHIDLTFDGPHPRYGTGAYARAEHDGFPPTIVAVVDALTLWGLHDRARCLFEYWLDAFLDDSGAVRYYGTALSEYGQLLATAARLRQRADWRAWPARCGRPLRALAGRALALARPDGPVALAFGSPEADTATDRATYFHNNAWLARGLAEWAALAEDVGLAAEAREADRTGRTLARLTIAAIRDAWPRDGGDWWLRPTAEPDGAGAMARPYGRVTGSRLGSYANYRYWPELLSSGVLPRGLARRVVGARLAGGGQLLGMTRFEGHLDDWPLAEHLTGLWALGRRGDYRLSLWGHVLYHQADGHLTAYEQVTLPPGRPAADYCLPCQLVAARAAHRLA